jgi:glucose/arabinose dehydrogenase
LLVGRSVGIRIVAVLFTLVVAAACSGLPDFPGLPPQPPSPAPTVTPSASASPSVPASPSPSPSASPSASPSPSVPAGPDLAAVAVTLTPVATLDAPIAMTVRTGDAATYVAERGGTVRAVRGGVVDAAPLVDLSAEVSTDGERGLLGLAFSPDGTRFYASYTDAAGTIHVDEWTMAGAGVDAASRRNVLLQEHPRSNHNGGQITFGPDGLLYVALGDGGGSGDPDGNGQSLGTLLGKILRIDPAPAAGAAYTVPADNPFVGIAGARGEIWAYGLRNPWRFSFDRATGDLWIGDVGQGALEEVDFLAGGGRGADLGWSDYEGTQLYNGQAGADGIPPITEYPTSDGCSVTGGYVYRGTAIPALQGAYVYGDFCNGQIQALAQVGGAVAAQVTLTPTVENLASFGEDAAGELYAISLSGTVYRFDPVA